MVALTGFDPTRDVRETLVASNGAPQSGLALARGNFDVARITAAANLKGAVSENYNGLTILEEPKQTHGVAFLDGTTVDFVKQGLNEAFRFRNPNVKGECGCGESFSV